jgi:hypothetical protein
MMSKEKPHVLLLTESEIKALANLVRVVKKVAGSLPYVQGLLEGGGDTAFAKLMKKIDEINKGE